MGEAISESTSLLSPLPSPLPPFTSPDLYYFPLRIVFRQVRVGIVFERTLGEVLPKVAEIILDPVDVELGYRRGFAFEEPPDGDV